MVFSQTACFSFSVTSLTTLPGEPTTNELSGMISKLEDFDYTMEQSEEGFKNFTVIKCKIKSIEWLYLAAKGHRRAKFDLETNKNAWLVP